VLTELCQQAGLCFVMAHCNFQLRGAESGRDETFVLSLAEHLNAPLFTRHFDTSTYAINNKVSIQVAARELRYTWFAQLRDYSSNPGSPLPPEWSPNFMA